MKKIIVYFIAILIFALSIVSIFKLVSKERVVLKDAYRVTMYTSPRQIQLSEVQLAFRIQGKDYKIIEHAIISGTVNYRNEGKQALVFGKGPGKDFRTWLTIDKKGTYSLNLNVKEENQEEVQVVFNLDVGKE